MAGCGWLFKAMEGPRRAQEDAGLLSRRRVQGGTKVPFHSLLTQGTLARWAVLTEPTRTGRQDPSWCAAWKGTAD